MLQDEEPVEEEEENKQQLQIETDPAAETLRRKLLHSFFKNTYKLYRRMIFIQLSPIS